MHERPVRRAPSPLSLTQPAPPPWHDERPAFQGDPFMDWVSEPEEPPKGPFDSLDERVRG